MECNILCEQHMLCHRRASYVSMSTRHVQSAERVTLEILITLSYGLCAESCVVALGEYVVAPHKAVPLICHRKN